VGMRRTLKICNRNANAADFGYSECNKSGNLFSRTDSISSRKLIEFIIRLFPDYFPDNRGKLLSIDLIGKMR